MSDTLVIGGTTYSGVTGFKATDSSDNTKTYIRPDGSLSITTNDTYDVTQYASAVVNVSGGSPNLQAKTGITPGASSVTVTPDTGYDGLSSVQIVGDENLVAGNIKSGVSIFSVTGTYAGGSSSVDRGTFTPSSNTLSASLTVTRTVVGVMIIAESNPYQAGSGVRCLSGCLYDSSGSVAKINLGSNNAGTSGSVSYGTSNLTVSQSGTTLTVSSKNAANSGYFISGITYRWIAW